MTDERSPLSGPTYADRELVRAFVTAVTAPDAATRQRADRRVDRWRAVLAGMADGTLRIGSRTPVEGLPAWVTLEVERGGFATGRALAEGPSTPGERALAARLGARDRGDLFDRVVTEPGLQVLSEVLATRTYRLTLPEEAVLLTVAWLVRAGDVPAATELVGSVRPLAGRLRYLPAAVPGPVSPPGSGLAPLPDAGTVWRTTAGAARTRLEGRRPQRRLEAQREAVTVWAPFADDVLAAWLATADPTGLVAARVPDGWDERARGLLAKYDDLARRHTSCTKHRRPKENLAVLLAEMRRAVAGLPPEPRRLGLLRAVCAAMTARRGVPGSVQARRHREAQAGDVRGVPFPAVARVVAGRLAVLPADRGLDAPEAVLGPTVAGESADVPAGTPVPRAVARVVRRSRAGTPEQLLAAGVVPSAEVLATLVPQITAEVVARAYDGADGDGALAALVTAGYGAFRSRRSLLLVDLQRQVRFEDLPWMRALDTHRTRQEDVPTGAVRRVAELALSAFPGTLLPNPLVAELGVLARSGGLDLPLVEELAADIFMGAFSPKFVHAAQAAARLLGGSLYARYYGIDCAALLALPVPPVPSSVRDAEGFAGLCLRRAGVPARWSVAGNGAVVEQAQILTTHNLAVLVEAGATPAPGWGVLAERAFERVVRLLGGLDRPGALRRVKDAAYAWRQTVFYLSLADRAEQRQWRAVAHERWRAAPEPLAGRVRSVLDGLDVAVAGGTPVPFTGWVATGRHPLLPAPTAPGRS